MPKREGDYAVAAKFYLREFRDGVVEQIPSSEHIEELEEQYPDTIILPHVGPGQRLAELVDQEAYSYRLGVVYTGETLLVDNLSWASTMFARNTQPPDPEIVGEDWKEMWLGRLKGSGLWLKQWLGHQWKDEYWKHGSVSVDYSDIKIPVLAVGGWADGYSNAIFRMMEHFDTPRKGIIGPWSHMYPHMGQPGPAIGFLQETLRWWNHWLKGMYSGITAEPMLSLWLQDYSKPAAKMQYRPETPGGHRHGGVDQNHRAILF